MVGISGFWNGWNWWIFLNGWKLASILELDESIGWVNGIEQMHSRIIYPESWGQVCDEMIDRGFALNGRPPSELEVVHVHAC